MGYDVSRRDELIAEGSYHEALALQTTLVRAAPDDPELRHKAAWLLMALRRFDDAAEEERRALDLRSEPRYARQLATCLARCGDPEGAEEAKELAERLELESREAFEAAQVVAKMSAMEKLQDVLEECLASKWFVQSLPLAHSSRLFEVQTLDTVAGWLEHRLLRYAVDQTASVPGVGAFHITNPGHIIQKRLARGIAWELPVAALLAELAARCDPDAIIAEVGANIGVHTVSAARHHRGRVVSFEPVRANYDQLVNNLALNGIDNVTAIDRACSSVAGRGIMHAKPEFANDPATAQLLLGGSGETEVTTLDAEVESLAGRVAILKLDVEGHEPSVLSGAATLLGRDRPVVICEIWGAGTSDTARTLEAAGYEGNHYFRSDWVFVPSAEDRPRHGPRPGRRAC